MNRPIVRDGFLTGLKWWPVALLIALLTGAIANAQDWNQWGCRRETRQYTLYDVDRYRHGSHYHETWTPRRTWYETRTYCPPEYERPRYGFEPWLQNRRW